mmetsp:Transcript_128203/g.256046  ORF Transcript_128203/g.256046 Transcript_128203/m.256046 type:complete len:392 (-) Transcript_128203:105-1280(-)
MAKEHQEYCEGKVYPIVEKLVTKTLLERPDLPVPFMVKWIAQETNNPIPTPQHLLLHDIRGLQMQIGELEQRLGIVADSVPRSPMAGPCSSSNPSIMHEGISWCLCTGPEFDVSAFEFQHGFQSTCSVVAVARGWRLSFCSKGVPLVEPAFATVVRGGDTDEVHGLAIGVQHEQLPMVKAHQANFEMVPMNLSTYDGQSFCGYAFIAKSHAIVPEALPSARHLQSFVRGARKVGLSEAYVEQLGAHLTYEPSAATLKARRHIPSSESLPKVTCVELSGMSDEGEVCHVSCLGYVMRVPKAKVFVGSHQGTDITQRVLYEWRGLVEAAGKGKWSYPTLTELGECEMEYVRQWLDHYLWVGGGTATSNCIIGFLSEFWQQQQECRPSDVGVYS